MKNGLTIRAQINIAAPATNKATPAALSGAMQESSVILLGEVHDNAIQHALRAAALSKLVESGARPAIAFEQFDGANQCMGDEQRK